MRSLRVAGHNEAVFVENIQDMAQSILQIAQAGDVIITMGAGSIGAVAAQVKNIAQEKK
jgi:UDP-N-acetylmuramate--alanine ligase